MTARRWLNLVNALLLGVVLGYMLRTHDATDRYLMAKTLKYETEASYYITKLDREIRETKGATK